MFGLPPKKAEPSQVHYPPWEKAVTDSEGYTSAEMATCQFCRFYHHSDGACHRRAPTPELDFIVSLVDELAAALPQLRLTGGTNIYWPSVEPSGFCGEFERGVALANETIDEQKERA